MRSLFPRVPCASSGIFQQTRSVRVKSRVMPQDWPYLLCYVTAMRITSVRGDLSDTQMAYLRPPTLKALEERVNIPSERNGSHPLIRRHEFTPDFRGRAVF